MHVLLFSCLFLFFLHPSPQLVCSSIIVGPVDHAHSSGVVKSRHAVVALRKSQRECDDPNQSYHNFCGGGGEARLQGVDDGHVPVKARRKWGDIENKIAFPVTTFIRGISYKQKA